MPLGGEAQAGDTAPGLADAASLDQNATSIDTPAPPGSAEALHLIRGRYGARMATTQADMAAVHRLRSKVFRNGAPDHDKFDPLCTHVLVEDLPTGALVCCFRLMHLKAGADLARSYAAQFYDLSALAGLAGPLLELGRFCVDPDRPDADALRVAWGSMTGYVDAHGVELLFGCSSFDGISQQTHAEAFALLAARHLAPDDRAPRIKASEVFQYASHVTQKPNLKVAQATMPPLLRTYLLMGGWVSDHAVIDRDLGTMHVFTGLEIRAVPPARARLLRAVAG